jgi:hypothetical protein
VLVYKRVWWKPTMGFTIAISNGDLTHINLGLGWFRGLMGESFDGNPRTK